MYIPLFFRVITLRVLLTSATASFLIKTPDIFHSGHFWWKTHWYDSVLPLGIILHHTLRLWRRRWWLICCEAVISLLEVIAIGHHFVPLLPIYEQESWLLWQEPAITTQYNVLRRGLSVVVMVSSLITCLFLLYDILSNHGENLLHPYDFSVGLRPPGHQWRFIFGKYTTKKRFSTDNLLIRCVRGGVAILTLLGMLGLVFYASIWQPLQGSDRPGIKLFQVPLGEGDLFASVLFNTLQSPPVLDGSEGLRWPLKAIISMPEILPKNYPTINMTASNYVPPTTGSDPGSLFTDPEQSCNQTQVRIPRTDAIVLDCFPVDSWGVLEILVTIKFPKAFKNVMPIAVYLILQPPTDPIEDIFTAVEPISTSPGTNIFGVASISVKERFLSAKAATAGIPQYRHFAIIKTHTVYPDLSHPSPQDNRTATLRINVPRQQFIEIEQEYLEGSALNGLAFIGGIWTLVNGIFAAIFGSTLLLVLFGVKPLSIYGLIHFLWPGRGSLVERGYTLSPDERDRIIGLLREHLLDKDEADRDKAPASRYNSTDILPKHSNSRGGGETQV